MKSLSIDGIKLNFIETNVDKSKTILFVHGNSHSHKTFEKQLSSDLLKDYRLVSVDLPGHGDSSKNGNYSLKNFGQLLHKFITNLGLKNVIVVGHSLGGHVSINLLKFYNPMGLLIFGTPPLKNPFDPSAFLANANAKALNLTTEATLPEIEALMNEMNYKNESLDQAVTDYLRTDPAFRQEIFGDIISGTHENEIALINSFRGDIMFLLATADSMINNNYILNEFRGTENILEIEAGHSPHIEASDSFNEMLLGFTKKVFEKDLSNTIINNDLQHESTYEQRD